MDSCSLERTDIAWEAKSAALPCSLFLFDTINGGTVLSPQLQRCYCEENLNPNGYMRGGGGIFEDHSNKQLIIPRLTSPRQHVL